MKSQFIFIVVFFAYTVPASLYSEYPASHYLHGRMNPQARYLNRYSTMERTLQLIQKHMVRTIIETGTSRSGLDGFNTDGSASIIFGDWARDHDATMYSVDIDPQALTDAQWAIGANKHVHLICQDSVAFLQDFSQQIDFLYLDSFDFDYDNPEPSQQHHLKEIIAAYPKLTAQSIVMIDDCGLLHGGKGALVIPYLQERGWSIVAQSYQVILMRNEIASAT